MAYAEIDSELYSAANSVVSTLQQVFQSFGGKHLRVTPILNRNSIV